LLREVVLDAHLRPSMEVHRRGLDRTWSRAAEASCSEQVTVESIGAGGWSTRATALPWSPERSHASAAREKFPLVALTADNGQKRLFGVDTGARETTVRANISNRLRLGAPRSGSKPWGAAGGVERRPTQTFPRLSLVITGHRVDISDVDLQRDNDDVVFVSVDGTLGSDRARGHLDDRFSERRSGRDDPAADRGRRVVPRRVPSARIPSGIPLDQDGGECGEPMVQCFDGTASMPSR
jgi:hypothetical protein